MAKKIYVGASGVAKKVKRAYVGVAGIAKKIKKAYIGVGGIARPCFSGGQLTYWGNSESGLIEGLDASYYFRAAGTIADTVVITKNDANTTLYNLYDKNLMHTTLPIGEDASEGHENSEAFVSYLVFDFMVPDSSGSGNSGALITVDANLLIQKRTRMGLSRNVGQVMTKAGSRLLFGYGEQPKLGGGSTFYSKGLESVDENLVRTAAETEREIRYPGGASVGKFGLIAGGENGTVTSSALKWVTAYNADLAQTEPEPLKDYKSHMGSTGAFGYAFFAGGHSTFGNDRDKASVEVYGEDLVRTDLAPLDAARYCVQGVTFGDCVLFLGGYETNSQVIDAYDENLVKVEAPKLEVTRSYLRRFPLGAINDYLLVGSEINRNTNAVEVLTK